VSDRRQPTTTSSFGVSGRSNHDASDFYARFTPPVLDDDGEVNPPIELDVLVTGDARAMTRVADGSVALVVTSPPYFAGKEYERALGEGHIPGSYLDFLQVLEDVFAECVRVLEPGGRIAVNVANLGRRPYRSLSADVIGILQDRLRLLLRGEVVWVKARGATGSLAWGSFRQPSNPVLRDLSERVIIASKGRFDRGGEGSGTQSKDEFMESTMDLWELPPESARRVGHPAPFPVELPQRLIELYTYPGDLVLDPFMGSGSTAVAAVRTGRHYVGYDTDPAYVAAAEARVAEASFAVPPPVESARALAADALADAGFVEVEDRFRSPAGTAFALRALDPHGTRWYVDVAGGFTTGPSGLRRSDLLWRAVGMAHTVQAHEPACRTLVLTSELPGPTGRPAVRALVDAGTPVLELTDPGLIGALKALLG
jgi:site-specific DNA-methyltransferase (adenine-specific)